MNINRGLNTAILILAVTYGSFLINDFFQRPSLMQLPMLINVLSEVYVIFTYISIFILLSVSYQWLFCKKRMI